MKNRLVRVNELIKRELGELISREFTFTQLVTVLEVDITPDLKHAHVYVSVLGDHPAAAMAQLHERRKELQSLLSKRVILKYTPQLHFKLDETAERGARIFELLQEIEIPEDEQDSEPQDPEQPENE